MKAFANPGENLPATSLTGISASSEKDCILVADFDRRYVRQFNLQSKQSKIVYRAAPQRKPRAVLRLLYRPLMLEQDTNVEKIAIVELHQNSGASFLVIASKDASETGPAGAGGEAEFQQSQEIALPEGSSSPVASVVDLPNGTLLCSVYNFHFIHEIGPQMFGGFGGAGEYEMVTQHPLTAKFRCMAVGSSSHGTALIFVGLEDLTIRGLVWNEEMLVETMHFELSSEPLRFLWFPPSRHLLVHSRKANQLSTDAYLYGRQPPGTGTGTAGGTATPAGGGTGRGTPAGTSTTGTLTGAGRGTGTGRAGAPRPASVADGDRLQSAGQAVDNVATVPTVSCWAFLPGRSNSVVLLDSQTSELLEFK